MKGMTIMLLVMALSLVVAGLWNSIPVIKNTVHTLLDPSAGAVLNWNVTLGLIIITGILTFITTLLQKYLTDQSLLKQIKSEQKLVQEEMKLYKSNPEKQMELSKKSMELAAKTMPITMRPVIYTIIPFVLFIRWFSDYFIANPVEILGFMSGLWAYIIFSIVWSIILRKVLNVQ
jgi:uncharacterized membrane protein (DUF106 family)